MEQRIQILDCTLRDGGQGFEAAAKQENSTERFSLSEIHQIRSCLGRSNIDILELGSISRHNNDMTHFAIYPGIEAISQNIPCSASPSSIYSALYTGPDIPLEEIPDWNPAYCHGARLIVRYSELERSMEYCRGLAQKGYMVFIQPMVTMRYTTEELMFMIRTANDIGAYALYFVDSYGYMQREDVLHFFSMYDQFLDSSIRIGFHAHNNINLAFSNALAFLQMDTQRKIILDSCIMGLGQGAGNLPTELIANYMNERFGTQYNYDAVMELCEIIHTHWHENLWGYSVTYMLSAIRKAAYKYAVELRERYKLSFVEINRVLCNIPEELRHRYTPENTIKLLQYNGYPI